MVEIIKNAPPPPERFGRSRAQWPFGDMEIGDAFDAPAAARNQMSAACSQRKLRKGEEYTVRQIDAETIRDWRLK